MIMNLRENKDNRKKLEEFNEHSKTLADIIEKRREIINDVGINPGQIWENTKGKRVVVTGINQNTVYFINKTGKYAFGQGTQKKDAFESEIFVYVGTAGETMINEFLTHDGRETSNIKNELKAVKADRSVEADLPF